MDHGGAGSGNRAPLLFMDLELKSPCKVNLLLNILGPRPDGFHELETVLQPVALCDTLAFDRTGAGIELSCSDPTLPVDSTNLVWRAAAAFFTAAGIAGGVRIHLDKKIPREAGLGGGSANAATTLRGLNQLFGWLLTEETLHTLAAGLGSDVPFFLQEGPALATGRGEVLRPRAPFPALEGWWVLLVHPGFGISTAWAYRALARFPEAQRGRPGRAEQLVRALEAGDLSRAAPLFYNALEVPAFAKFPWLELAREFLEENGAAVSRMSGSGSALFALVPDPQRGEALRERMLARFGARLWTTVVPLGRG